MDINKIFYKKFYLLLILLFQQYFIQFNSYENIYFSVVKNKSLLDSQQNSTEYYYFFIYNKYYAKRVSFQDIYKNYDLFVFQNNKCYLLFWSLFINFFYNDISLEYEKVSLILRNKNNGDIFYWAIGVFDQLHLNVYDLIIEDMLNINISIAELESKNIKLGDFINVLIQYNKKYNVNDKEDLIVEELKNFEKDFSKMKNLQLIEQQLKSNQLKNIKLNPEDPLIIIINYSENIIYYYNLKKIPQQRFKLLKENIEINLAILEIKEDNYNTLENINNININEEQSLLKSEQYETTYDIDVNENNNYTGIDAPSNSLNHLKSSSFFSILSIGSLIFLFFMLIIYFYNKIFNIESDEIDEDNEIDEENEINEEDENQEEKNENNINTINSKIDETKLKKKIKKDENYDETEQYNEQLSTDTELHNSQKVY